MCTTHSQLYNPSPLPDLLAQAPTMGAKQKEVVVALLRGTGEVQDPGAGLGQAISRHERARRQHQRQVR